MKQKKSSQILQWILIGLMIAAINLFGAYQEKTKAAKARPMAVPAVERSEA